MEYLEFKISEYIGDYLIPMALILDIAYAI